MRHSWHTRFGQHTQILLVLCAFSVSQFARAQTPPDPSATPKTDSTASSSPQSPAQANSNGSPASDIEVSSQDTTATFQVRVNLVLVRVVVRDAQGKVIPGLKKEDFQLFDNRKPQTISSFSVETPESHTVVAKAAAPAAAETANSTEASAPTPALAPPQRFVSMVFDDAEMSLDDVASVRVTSKRIFDSLAPSDRVGIYTTSGQFVQEFTAEREKLEASLTHILPRPLVGGNAIESCPNISYYQADRIMNFSDSEAFEIALSDTVDCAFNGKQGDPKIIAEATPLVKQTVNRVLAAGDSQTGYIYRHLQEAVRRLSEMPGQRVMVFVSPGFLVTASAQEGGDLIDRANRANVVIDTIDARGLYTPDLVGDVDGNPHENPVTASTKARLSTAAQSAQSEILGQLADGTGGTCFHNRNDLDEGLRRAVSAPSLSYLIGFSPQNLKTDGHYHTLKVSVVSKEKYIVQARHGYYAPRTIADPAAAAKEEIQDAIFSRDEIFDLPIDFRTQFFKPDQTNAQLAVLTHVDVKGVHFRKADGRSRDDLTVTTAIFDENGNFVTGGEKIVKLRLSQPTFVRLSRSGFTIKSNFDLKPGSYVVRLVVRDAESTQMGARNGAVVIPN